jgi:hypothetical protein
MQAGFAEPAQARSVTQLIAIPSERTAVSGSVRESISQAAPSLNGAVAVQVTIKSWQLIDSESQRRLLVVQDAKLWIFGGHRLVLHRIHSNDGRRGPPVYLYL